MKIACASCGGDLFNNALRVEQKIERALNDKLENCFFLVVLPIESFTLEVAQLDFFVAEVVFKEYNDKATSSIYCLRR